MSINHQGFVMRIRDWIDHASRRALPLGAAAVMMCAGAARADTIDIGIGTQDTTTNTVTGGVVLKQLGLLEKYLPRTGKYKDVTYHVTWQNATSGPPITNGMVAGNLQIGMMGDYPLLVNGATGQATGNDTELVAVIAYNALGGGNGLVVPKDSPYYDLNDLKGKRVSVPFGSAAHGMLLAALQSRQLPSDYFTLVNQSPEVGSTSIQEHRIDGHADFVPFAELLPFRGYARKIFDGVETGQPTFHGVVVRKDFGQKYPEIVVAYIKALMAADEWVRQDPVRAAEQLQAWTKVDKEVVYMFLGPGGIHTLDPTIKPRWIAALKTDYAVLKKLNMVKDLDIDKWVNDSFVRQAFKESGLDYDKQLASFSNYLVQGRDPVCDAAISDPSQVGQVWLQDGPIVSFSSAACTLRGVNQYRAEGKKLNAVYLTDKALGVKVFANDAFYTLGGADGQGGGVTAFLLKRDADASALKSHAKVAGYEQALKAVSAGGN
jgi:NitT/TauT family transport system substrate-binding protein